MEVVLTAGAIRRAELQSNRRHQQTNTHLFTGRMPFLSPKQQCQSTEALLLLVLLVYVYLTLPYGEGVLPPSAEASGGPSAHPRLNWFMFYWPVFPEVTPD